VVQVGDIWAQVRRTLKNISDVLEPMGGCMCDVISLDHYATDILAFMGTGDIRTEF
jgi:enamine deaminase RidA (YjgF/YER057c/UK114 family)